MHLIQESYHSRVVQGVQLAHFIMCLPMPPSSHGNGPIRTSPQFSKGPKSGMGCK